MLTKKPSATKDPRLTLMPTAPRIHDTVELLRRGKDAEAWRKDVRECYEASLARRQRRRMPYYYQRLIARLRHIVPAGARVLDIGCDKGHMLAGLEPSVGVGIDLVAAHVESARRTYPHLTFNQLRAEEVCHLEGPFDYIIISQTLSEIYDIVALLQSLHHLCHDRTRLVIVNYSRLWQPALHLAEVIGVKRPSPPQNWIPTSELGNLLSLSGWESIRSSGATLVPLKAPLLSDLLNRYVANLPLVDALCLNHIMVARPAVSGVSAVPQCGSLESVSIVVPARNESGHIRQLLARIPNLAPHQEVVFVEGHSTDDTWLVIQEVVKSYRGPWHLRCVQQGGKGKADAVRTAFDLCSGDVLVILDADISVPPEELIAFRDALASGRAEFVNGSRMVYLMDKKAMRFLNLLGNKFFGGVFTYLLSQRFRDTLCGTKMLRRSDYERIVANRSHFGDFDPFGDFDLLFGAARLNLKIVDVPVHYKARTYGETNISRFRHGLILLKMCALAARKIKFV